MKRSILILMCTAAWPGCVALPEEGGEAPPADGAIEEELVLDGGSARPPVGPPYRGPQCVGNVPSGGTGGGGEGPGGGDAAVPSGDGDGDGDVGGSGGEPSLPDDAGVIAPGLPRPQRAGDVLITEIMFDPKGRPDTDGEWIELWNPGAEALSLEGCELDDGASTRRTLDAIAIEPDAYATIGRGPDAGFVPNLAVAIALTNTSDTVAVLCDGIEIDRVSYDGTFPLRAGASLSLDPSLAGPLENDDPASWCIGVLDYGGDLGTPGGPNPSCSPADAGAL